MPFTPDLFSNFDSSTGLMGLSNPDTNLVNISATGINHDLSAPISDLIDFDQQAGLSSPLMNYADSPVLILGIDPSTGMFRPLTPTDPLVKTDGSPAFATGIHGLTGIQGTTGIALQGVTGINGATGVMGLTGIQGLSGFTGILGLEGATGAIGDDGLQGPTGLTGFPGISANPGTIVIGNTGLRGTTGVTGNTGIGLQGPTGLGGAEDIGLTGIQGITGTSSSAQGLTGLQGIIGNTGIRGLTGVQLNGSTQPPNTLNVNTSASQNMQYTVAGNTLSIDNNYLDIIAHGTLMFGASNRLNILFGGITIFDDNIFAETTPSFYIKCKIFRNNLTEQLCVVDVIASSNYKKTTRTITSNNLSNTVLLQFILNNANPAFSGTINALIVRLIS